MKYYAVAKGHMTGIFRSLADVRRATKGYWGKVYKAFRTEEEAKAFLLANGCTDPDFTCPIPIYAYAIGCMSEGRFNAPGGYGITVMEEDRGSREFSGGFNKTYDWRIDLMAVVTALEELTKENRVIVLHTGSWYIVDAIYKGWLEQWKSRRFWMDGGIRVQNVDLWNKIWDHIGRVPVRFVYVDKRNSNPMKLRAETLAREAANRSDLPDDNVYIRKRRR